MSDAVVVLFMSRYNEIDHMVPVAYRWLRERDVPLYVVLTAYRDYSDDFRFDLLREFEHCTITHRRELLSLVQAGESIHDYDRGTGGADSGSESESGSGDNSGRSLVSTVKTVGKRMPTDIPERLWGVVSSDDYELAADAAPKMLRALTDGADRAIVAFDWQELRPEGDGRFRFPYRIIEAAHESGYRAVSLPHGDRSYRNAIYLESHLETLLDRDELERDADDLFAIRYGELAETRRKYTPYDRYVVPNEYCAERMRPIIDEEVLTVRGSPRFNREWLETLLPAVPAYDPDYEVGDALRIVVFTRQPYFFINTRLAKRTLRVIAGFPDVHVTVKGHTRHDAATREHFGPGSDLAEADIPNLDFIWGPDIHSPSLLEWADVAVDFGSSITFEAIQREMPIFCLDFTHGNAAILSEYLPGCGMDCVDDLVEAVQVCRREGPEPNYTDANRAAFIDAVVENQDGPVLNQYVSLFDDLLDAQRGQRAWGGV